MSKISSKKELSFFTVSKYLLLVLSIVGVIFSLYYTFTNITSPQNINIVLALPFLIFLGPYLAMELYGIKKVEAKMAAVPRFLRDVVDNVESGMDLVSSIKGTLGNEYSSLNEDVRKLANQLSWGIEFDKALINFANNVGSYNLRRDLYLVIEARRVGGHVEQILRELSEKINTELLRLKERKSNLASNTFTGYISFVIFIFIIILVYNNLFIGLGDTTAQASGGAQNAQTTIYLTLLTLLSYELAVLSGFLFGLMQENNILSGAPHVVILSLLTFIGFFFFISF
jgi:flagellar protein FlaJ